MNQSGGGGGASAFSGLSDVAISSPSNGQVPVYNSGTSKWENGAVSGSDVASAYWNARNSFTATALLPGQYNNIPLNFPLGDQSNWSADGNLTCLQSGLYSILAISAINGVVDSGFGSNNGYLSTRILINYHTKDLEPGAGVDAPEGTSVALTALDAYFFYALQGFSLQVLNGGSVAGAVTTTVHLVKLF